MIAKKLPFFIVFVFLFSTASFSTVYYVAPNGNDVNSGTIGQPFLTVQRAQTAVVAGDTVYMRGGTYAMTTAQINTYSSPFAYVIYLTKNGTAGKRINYWAYPGEKPIFDFTAVKPANYRVYAFEVFASYVYIKGIEVVGVQVTITAHTQSECFDNQGSNNIYENLSMHDGMAIGFYLTKGGNNTILNCDAYNNFDSVSEDHLGGNTDGFGCHPNKQGVGYTNNMFKGCRAWFNSDDGYDCINAFEATTFDSCWSFYNGYSTAFVSKGDGNGFKGGGYGVSLDPSVPAVIPRNNIRFCLAIRNKSNGFYSNHHLGGSDWFNNSAYFNAVNYNMLNRSADYTADVAGYGHNLKNNLGYGGRSTEYSNLDFNLCNADTNYFNLPVTVSSADFLSTDQTLLMAPRQADGSLPNVNFMKLAPSSDLIDQGLNIGYNFNSTAPDLGCFESPYASVFPVPSLNFIGCPNLNLAVARPGYNAYNGEPTTIYNVDATTGSAAAIPGGPLKDPTSGRNIDVNAAGINTLDGLLYAIKDSIVIISGIITGANARLYRIAKNYNTSSVGTLPVPPLLPSEQLSVVNPAAGCFDDQGNYYFTGMAGSYSNGTFMPSSFYVGKLANPQLLVVGTATLSATWIKINFSGANCSDYYAALMAPISSTSGIAAGTGLTDVTYSKVDNKLYTYVAFPSPAASNAYKGQLLSIDPGNGVVACYPTTSPLPFAATNNEVSGISTMANGSIVIFFTGGDMYKTLMSTSGAYTGSIIKMGASGIAPLGVVGSIRGDLASCGFGSAATSPSFTGSISPNSTTENAIIAFPNPAHKVVTIIANHSLINATIRLVGLAGNLLIENNSVSGNSFQLSLSNYPKGIYLVEIIENGNSSRSKIIIE